MVVRSGVIKKFISSYYMKPEKGFVSVLIKYTKHARFVLCQHLYDMSKLIF